MKANRYIWWLAFMPITLIIVHHTRPGSAKGNLISLQQFGRYQPPEISPVCDYYHHLPKLAFIGPSMVLWRCPYGIGYFTIKFRN
jgi:hypothetical protein